MSRRLESRLKKPHCQRFERVRPGGGKANGFAVGGADKLLANADHADWPVGPIFDAGAFWRDHDCKLRGRRRLTSIATPLLLKAGCQSRPHQTSASKTCWGPLIGAIWRARSVIGVL